MKQSLLVFLDHHDLYAMKYVTLLLRDVKEKSAYWKVFLSSKDSSLKDCFVNGKHGSTCPKTQLSCIFTEINLFLVFLNYYITVSLSCIVF